MCTRTTRIGGTSIRDHNNIIIGVIGMSIEYISSETFEKNKITNLYIKYRYVFDFGVVVANRI